MPDSRTSFTSIGDVMVDVVCAGSPAPGTRMHAEVALVPGGSAVTAAMAARASGAAAVVIGRIGSDPAGDLIATALEARGIRAQLARDSELPTGTAVALMAETTTVVAQRGANARLSPADLPPSIGADALFVSGFALFQTGSQAAARAAIDRFTGRWCGVDLASPTLATDADAGGNALTAGANVILATADEARALTGAEPEEAAHLLAAHFTVVCIKLGEDGAVAAYEGRLERGSAKRVVRRTPFGAGDAFGGALLVALADGQPMPRALQLACEAGAQVAAGG